VGSTGIFGIVGVKKATIKARPRAGVKPLEEIDQAPAEPAPEPQAAPAAEARPEPAPKPEPAAEARPEPAPPPARPAEKEVARREPAKPPARPDERPKAPAVAEQPRPPAKTEQPRPEPDEEEHEPQPFQTSALDPVVLERTVREVVEKLLLPIVEKPKLTVQIEPDKVNVFVDDEEHSGLIIGREGQTLSALQYVANRVVARKMHASVRVQIDTGEYRERQDDKLRQLAFHLAEKAGSTGRIQSTKPLSSYHRRVVHLALQDNEVVFTRSKGEGPMKRVLILPKRGRNSGNSRGGDERA